jgi:hemerythrin superfamily protein
LLWYPGTVYASNENGYHVVFDDQDQAIVGAADILPLVVQEGDRVLCRPKFERELRVHMDAEEAYILPLYRERAGKVLGGDPDFFTLEHKNILRNLETAKESLRKLAVDPAAGRRQAHEFLDQEGMLLHLLEHHDLREKNTLYPRLDEVLTEAEREDLLRRCGRAT